jgi:hypothetical protein
MTEHWHPLFWSLDFVACKLDFSKFGYLRFEFGIYLPC